jgi:flagellar biosynthesis protein FlhB
VSRSDSKTEKATPKRRKDARREGTVAKSQEVAVAFSLATGVLALRFFTPAGLQVMETETIQMIGRTTGDRLEGAVLAESAARMMASVAGPFLLVAVVAGVSAGAVQVGFKLAPKAAKPKLSNISPKKGLKRFKPATAGWEFVRSSLKLGLLVAVLWAPLRAWSETIGRERGLDAGLSSGLNEIYGILLRAMLLAVVVAAADYAWNRWRTEKELKMAKHEVKREHKDTEGDPHQRAQRRRRQSDLSRNRMLRDVATADVVVTNPTHFAVALRYGEAEAAPRVVAKGADRAAAKIRKIAYRHGVVVTEDKTLARALYRRCKLGDFVPAALYEAVAVVLATAYRRYGRVAA